MTLKSRYPGIRAFEEDEQFLFFGRNEDIRRLYAQVLANSIVVLFAKSGIGKSSLLSAGLVPLLDYDRFQTVKVRYQNTATNPTETLKKALEDFLDEKTLKAQTGFSAADAPLWEYIRACRFERYEETAVPVLVFDQFEEFFEHAVADRQEFVQGMADLVANRLPRRVYDSKADADWRKPMPIKVIFAIRSDRMSFLHNLGNDIPAILQNRFELRPLDRAAAREAIVRPAAISGRKLATKPFSYSPAALDIILDALENRNAEVESFQLQLICQNIEKQLIKNPALAEKPIETGLFGGAEGIQNILQNYYEDTLAELPAEEQGLARDFVERGLIVGGRRVGVTEGVEQAVWKISPELLNKLLVSRLLRAETTHLGKSFEVSHDALVEPIVRSFRVREAKRLEREAAEQREIAERERSFREKAQRDATRARLYLYLSVLLFLSTIVVGYMSLTNSRDSWLRQANHRLHSQEFDEAVAAYDQVLDNGLFNVTFYDRSAIQTLRDSARHMEGVQGIVLTGDTLYLDEKYMDALRQYELAQRLGYRKLEDKIRRTEDIRSRTLELYRRKAIIFEQAIDKRNDDDAHELACIYYCFAYELDPDSPELKEKVQHLDCPCAKK
jgi:hypothetical protein